ncbi:conserved hypothetical protein [Xenorhabdus bovienii str. Jollieti]|nr:conserved hypothetical protein [Xenorhabdus bovienii str. Jollieti]
MAGFYYRTKACFNISSKVAFKTLNHEYAQGKEKQCGSA